MNPGPHHKNGRKSIQQNEAASSDHDSSVIITFLQELRDRSEKIEQGQSQILYSLKSVTCKQQELAVKVTIIADRLQSVENKLSFQSCRDEVSGLNLATERLSKENEVLRARLNDLEDRSRRDSLLFFWGTGCARRKMDRF